MLNGLSGLAIRLAQSLGLHQEETFVIYNPDERRVRSRLWQSLFIVDRLLSASLGRPPATTDDNWDHDRYSTPIPVRIDAGDIRGLCNAGLEAATRSSHIIGLVLQHVYQQRKISTATARKLADKCVQWSRTLPDALRWQHNSPYNLRQARAIFHANLTYWHSIVLLTRPFFLYLVSNQIQSLYLNNPPGEKATAHGTKIASFANSCITASTNTINITCDAWRGGYLSAFNFFSTDHLFAACLVILTKHFAWISDEGSPMQLVEKAIVVLENCGKLNTEAKRSALILRQYMDVIYSLSGSPEKTKSNNQDLRDLPQPATTFTTNPPFSPPAYFRSPSSLSLSSMARSLSQGVPEMSHIQGPTETLAPEPSFSNEEVFASFMDSDSTLYPLTSENGDPYASEVAIDFQGLWHGPMDGVTACQY